MCPLKMQLKLEMVILQVTFAGVFHRAWSQLSVHLQSLVFVKIHAH